MGRRRRPPVELDAAELGPVLHELMPIGAADELPERVLGHHDINGHCRRIVAAYANGWQVTVRLNTKLEVTSVGSAIRLVARKPARA